MNQPKAIPAQQVMIIWAALLATQFVLVAVSFIQLESMQGKPSDIDFLIRFSLIGVVVILFGWIVPRYLRQRANRNGGKAIASPQAMRQEHFESTQEMSPEHFQAFIVRLALFDFATIVGYIASILGHDPRWVIGFFIANLVNFVLNCPTRNFVERWITAD